MKIHARRAMPYFMKMLASYILLTSIVVSVLCAAFIYFTFRNKLSELDAYAHDALLQTSYSADILYEQVAQIGASLMSDPTVRGFITNSARNPVEEYEAHLIISRIQAVYPFIHSILLCDADESTVLSSYHGKLLADDPHVMDSLRAQILARDAFRPITLPVYSGEGKNTTVNGLAFSFYPQNYRLRNYALVIVVQQSYLRKLINDIELSGNTRILVASGSGEIITDTGAGDVPERIDAWLATITEADQVTGRISDGQGRSRLFITYVKTQLLNWIFVRISDYSTDVAPLYNALTALLIIGLVLLAVGITMSFVVTKRLYRPMGAVIGKIQSISHGAPGTARDNEYAIIEKSLDTLSEYSSTLERRLDEAMPHLRPAQLRALLTGTSDALYKELDQGRCYRVLLVKIHGAAQPDACCKMLHSMFAETYAGDITFEYFIEPDGQMTLISIFHRDMPMPVFLQGLQSMQDVLRTDSGLLICCAIGDAAPDIRAIQESYRSAWALMRHRFVLRPECLITQANLDSLLSGSSPYIKGAEERIVAALRSMQMPSHELDMYFDYLADEPYERCIIGIKLLMQAIQQAFEADCAMIMRSEQHLGLLLIDIASFEFLTDVKGALVTLCEKLIDVAHERTEQNRRILVSQVALYVMENYHNPELSVEMIAAAIRLSAAYVRKAFKADTGVSLRDYITDVRLEKARDMLINTDKTAVKICEEVGFYSNTYFTTLFKKKYGASPIQYRQSMVP